METGLEELKRFELEKLLRELELRDKNYRIIDFDYNRIPQQQQLVTYYIDREKQRQDERKRYNLYYGGNGAGKCHGADDKILLYSGEFKKAKDIKVDDVLMGINSKPRVVEKIGGGRGMMYKITPESGEPIYVNGLHQLLLVHRRRNKKGERLQNNIEVAPEGNIVQISVEDYLNKSTKWKAEAYMWRPSIINYERKELPLEPYFIGAWLGDGDSSGPGLTNIDNEVINYFKDYAFKLGMSLSEYHPENRVSHYRIVKNNKSRYGYNLYNELRELNLLYNKHIPLEYLTSSEEQRLELLAGLIDTDGEVNHTTPRYSITQKNEELARNIMQLARSLGFRSNITKCKKTCTNNGVIGTYYRVSINGDVWRIPCKIKRKQFKEQSRRHNKDWRVSKFTIEENGIDNFYGFEVSGDHLYLDYNFIVQHNTAVGSYITALLALGEDCKKLGLPYIGHKKKIWIGTKSGSNVKGVIDPYLNGEYSISKIPDEFIEKKNYDNTILKSITMKNGTMIYIYTYDQGYENWQGGNPDFIWLDEEPVDEKVFMEVIARMRNINCELLITMTPLNGETRVYDYFVATENSIIRNTTNVYSVSSLDNPFTDKTWTEGMTEEEYNMRVLGMFENVTGLVYKEFKRHINVIPEFNLRELGNYKVYIGLDFGTSHPTGVVFIAQDDDDNLIIFDEIYRSNTYLEDIAKEIKDKSRPYHIEYIIRDTAAKREGLEISKYGIKTTPADKHSKGENDMSNRRTGILLINTLLKNKKIFVTENCKNLIKEFQSHKYKENGKKDGDVDKINDDLLDALRYVVFNLKHNKIQTKKMSEYEKKFKEKIIGLGGGSISFL